jgi:prephenate dehydrogenase
MQVFHNSAKIPSAVLKPLDTVAIIGVGPVGLALRERGLARRVIGVGRRESALAAAREMGAVTDTTLDLPRGVADAELIVVCTPVDTVARHVLDVASACRQGALITDVGSTKDGIVKALEGPLSRGARFVGSHPLAGSENTGVKHARADLFEDRVVIVTPGQTTAEEETSAVIDFWSALSARVVRMTPQRHDEVVAGISHLPHVVACALAEATESAQIPLAASGWRDTTRIAAGDPALWTPILLANRTHVLKGMDEFEKTWAALRSAIDQGDEAVITRLLEEAKRKRDAVGS